MFKRWKGETAAEIGIRRQAFVRAMRVHSKEAQAELGTLVEAADVADLEWLISRIDEQLRNIPLNVQHDQDRADLVRDYSHQRTWISGVLENKRTVAATRSRHRDTAWKVTMLVVAITGIAIGVIVKLVKG